MIKAALTVLVVVFGAAGCLSANPPVPVDRFYQLGPVDVTSPQASPALRGALRLDYVNADPMRSGRAVLYRESGSPLELQRYRYEFWVDQPPAMVYRALLGYLRDGGVADRVLGAGETGQARFRLKARLLRFEQVRDGRVNGVEVALEAALYDDGTGALAWSRVYQQEQSAAGNTLHATARAFQQAVSGAFRDLLTDLAETPAGS